MARARPADGQAKHGYALAEIGALTATLRQGEDLGGKRAKGKDASNWRHRGDTGSAWRMFRRTVIGSWWARIVKTRPRLQPVSDRGNPSRPYVPLAVVAVLPIPWALGVGLASEGAAVFGVAVGVVPAGGTTPVVWFVAASGFVSACLATVVIF